MAAVFVVSIPTVDYEQKVRDAKVQHANGVGGGRHHVVKIQRADQNESQPKPTKIILEEVLKLLKITKVTWRETANGKFHQVMFPVESQNRLEQILDALDVNVIEHSPKATVSVVPCSIYSEKAKTDDDSDASTVPSKEESVTRRQMSEFLRSIKARLTIAQVVEGVRAGGELNFDFVLRIIIAGMIASVGLMDDNILFFVASMLVCPLMGPIMALSFGLMIKDRNLSKTGIRSELAGLAMTILIGFIFGLIFGPWQVAWQKGLWPTDEMEDMGIVINLWVGALVAVPSGAGVALALLRDNVSSLVGVAVATSLLPPCVNTGVLWANSAIIALKGIGESEIMVKYIDPETGEHEHMLLKPAYKSPADYSYFYSYNHATECLVLGAVSLILAFVNIVFILLTALLVLKIKEVAPSSKQPLSRFWTEDIKIARDYNRNLEDNNKRPSVDQTFMEEWVHMNGMVPSSPQPSIKTMRKMKDLANIMQEAEQDIVFQAVVRSTNQRIATDPHVIVHRGMLSARSSLVESDTAAPRFWDMGSTTIHIAD